jgi:hypothetical protein
MNRIVIKKDKFLRRGFFALRCLCNLYLKCIFDIFENIKKNWKKMFCVHVLVLGAYKFVSIKTNFLYGLCKNDKIWYSNRPFRDAYFFSFLHRAQRISVFHETLCDHVEYGDIYVHIFFLFFWHFKIYFLDKESICTWDEKCIPKILAITLDHPVAIKVRLTN